VYRFHRYDVPDFERHAIGGCPLKSHAPHKHLAIYEAQFTGFGAGEKVMDQTGVERWNAFFSIC